MANTPILVVTVFPSLLGPREIEMDEGDREEKRETPTYFPHRL